MSEMSFSLNEFNEIFEERKDKKTLKKDDHIFMQPYDYQAQQPGKKFTSFYIRAFNHWLKVPSDKLLVISEVIEMLMISLIIRDDILDGSDLRRGAPVAHSIYGIPATIVGTDITKTLALEKLYLLGKPEALKICFEELLATNRGQALEIYWRDNFICPEEKEYLRMANLKASSLLNFVGRTMLLFSDEKNIDLTRLMQLIGTYHQLRNDYNNLMVEKYFDLKGFCDDLTEGKFSFPTVHAIRAQNESGEVAQILRQKTKDVDLKKHCVSVMEKLGSFKYTSDALDLLGKEMRKEADLIGPNPILNEIFDSLLDWKKGSD